MGSNNNIPITSFEMLLLKGAEIDVENEAGITPFCIAAENCNHMFIRNLAAYGGDVNYIMKTGKFQGGTVLHSAAANADLETFKLLVEIGGNLCLKDWRGRTPLHWSAREGHLPVMKHILSLPGNDILSEDYGGLSPLHMAAAGGNIQTASWLIKNNVNVNIKDLSGWTPLHSAADNGHLAIINLLLDNKANINMSTAQGSTALHLAAMRGEIETVKELLKRGARINALDNFFWTPLRFAETNKNIDLINLLKSQGGHLGGSPNLTMYVPLF